MRQAGVLIILTRSEFTPVEVSSLSGRGCVAKRSAKSSGLAASLPSSSVHSASTMSFMSFPRKPLTCTNATFLPLEIQDILPPPPSHDMPPDHIAQSVLDRNHFPDRLYLVVKLYLAHDGSTRPCRRLNSHQAHAVVLHLTTLPWCSPSRKVFLLSLRFARLFDRTL